jgi:prophage regulatory protein
MTRRTINKATLLKMISLSHTTIYSLEKAGDFPARFYLTAKTPAWDYDEVLDWIAKRKAMPITPKVGPDVTKRRARPVKNLTRSAP